MFIFTAAIAISAWLLFSPLRGGSETSNLDRVKMLRDLVAHNFTVSQPIIVAFGDRGFRFPDLVEATQKQLDFRLQSEGIPYKYNLIDNLPKSIPRPPTELEQMRQREVILTDEGVSFSTEAVSKTGSNTARTSETVENVERSDTAPSQDPRIAPKYSLELQFHDVPRLSLDLVDLKVYMSYNLDFIHQNDVPFYMTQSLFDMLLQADLDMWRELRVQDAAGHLQSTRRFSDVIRELKVNIVAAEESGVTVPEIVQTIETHMKRFDAISDFVKITPHIQVLDVSKRRAAANLLQNSTKEISFFYSTTMRPYADRIQGVPIRHIDPIEKETDIQGDVYGTEYQERLRLSQIDRYNVTSFLNDVNAHIHALVPLPSSTSPSLRLAAESAMKHYTLMGITEVLDALIVQGDQLNTALFSKVAKFVDDILVEEEHDWAGHLDVIAQLHSEVS